MYHLGTGGSHHARKSPPQVDFSRAEFYVDGARIAVPES
jgi:hypothetical protein